MKQTYIVNSALPHTNRAGLGVLQAKAEAYALALREERQRILKFDRTFTFDSPISSSDLGLLALQRRVCAIDYEAHISSEGLLEVLPGGGFAIRCSRPERSSRARFTVAHELGHTYFYDIHSTPARAKVPADLEGLTSIEEESFCDAFAAGLLFPRGAAKRSLANQALGRGPSLLAFVEQTCLKWGVSTQVVLRRLDEIGSIPDGFLCIVLGLPADSRDREMRVKAVYPSRVSKWFIPRNQRAASLGFVGAQLLSAWWWSRTQPGAPLRRSAGGSLGLGKGYSVVEGRGAVVEEVDEEILLWKRHIPGASWMQQVSQVSSTYRFIGVGPTDAYCLAFLRFREHTSGRE